jgi:Ca2+-binding RTX toxin-like protein
MSTQNTTVQMIEQLEARQLLSVSMQDGIVLVTGTDAADSVQILATTAGAQPTLTVELWTADQGTVCNFALSDVKGIKVDGLGGNDQLFVDRSAYEDVAIPVTLFGGAGDDVLVGGGGADELVGGTGNDWIDAGNGAWLESSDAWIARSDATTDVATPRVDGEHPATGDDQLSLDTGDDHLDAAGPDRLMPATTADSAPANNTLFSDTAIQDDAAIWNA